MTNKEGLGGVTRDRKELALKDKVAMSFATLTYPSNHIATSSAHFLNVLHS